MSLLQLSPSLSGENLHQHRLTHFSSFNPAPLICPHPSPVGPWQSHSPWQYVILDPISIRQHLRNHKLLVVMVLNGRLASVGCYRAGQAGTRQGWSPSVIIQLQSTRSGMGGTADTCKTKTSKQRLYLYKYTHSKLLFKTHLAEEISLIIWNRLCGYCIPRLGVRRLRIVLL